MGGVLYFCGMSYNERNAHARDRRLHFDAPTHTYYVDRESDGSQFVCESVTTIVEGLFEQFDADYWAARKATPEGERSRDGASRPRGALLPRREAFA